MDLGISIDMFKENIMQLLLDQSRAEIFNSLPTSVKSYFTKTYNIQFKSSIKPTKKSKKESADKFSLARNLNAED